MKSLTSRVLLALAAGLAAGTLISQAKSPSLSAVAFAIKPVGILWVNALNMTVIPLVVSLLVTGIGSTTQADSMGRLGAKAILLFLVLLSAAAAFAALIAPPLFSLLSIDPITSASLRSDVAVAGQGPDVLPPLSEWVTGLVPSNVIAAAAEGSMLPVLVFAVLFGFAATRIPAGSREQLVGFFRSISEVMLVLVRWILLLAPLGVFGLALRLHHCCLGAGPRYPARTLPCGDGLRPSVSRALRSRGGTCAGGRVQHAVLTGLAAGNG